MIHRGTTIAIVVAACSALLVGFSSPSQAFHSSTDGDLIGTVRADLDIGEQLGNGSYLFPTAATKNTSPQTFTADSSADLETDAIVKAAEPYLRVINQHGNTLHYIALRTAASDGVSVEFLRAFASINDMLGAGELYGDRGLFPVWGNWCGPLHSGPGAPVDLLDRACMRHDKCYSWGGGNCSCDKALIANIDKDFERMAADAQRVAKIIRAAFVLKTKGC